MTKNVLRIRYVKAMIEQIENAINMTKENEKKQPHMADFYEGYRLGREMQLAYMRIELTELEAEALV